jgi:hypothetical protein
MTFVFLATLGLPVLAAPMYQGRPTDYNAGNSSGYYIWQDGERWYVQTANTGTQRLFSGMIETDGSFVDVSTMPSEKVERVAMDVRSQKIEFSFNSLAKNDGFSFSLINSQNATFTFYIDGRPVDSSNIYIGRQNRHPNSHSFSINNKPNENGYNNWSPNNETTSRSRFQGQPTELNPGNVFGYFIWQEQNRWVVQTTTTGNERQFNGTIETDGTISDVQTSPSQRSDGQSVNTANNKINFTFKTGGTNTGVSISLGEGIRFNKSDKMNEFSFRVTDGSILKFNLYADGQLIDPANIYLGRENQHPSSGSGTLKIDFRNQ